MVMMKQQGSFEYKTERYHGSKINIHTISWKGHGEIDTDEIRRWCVINFGPSGYQEEIGGTRWLFSVEDSELILCKDEDLTFFLLKWT